MKLFLFYGYIILSFLLPDSVRAKEIFSSDSIQIIRLYLPFDEYTSRYCGTGLTKAICELNNVYKDHGILFSLSSESDSSVQNSVLSLFTFRIEETVCSVRYEISDIENLIQIHKKNHFSPEIKPPSTMQLVVTKPPENSVVHYSGVDFSWSKSDASDQYLLEIAKDIYYTETWISTVVFGTRCFISDLPKNTTLYWHIKPLNFIHYCEDQRASGKFYVSEIYLKPFTLKGVSMYSMPPPNEKAVFINNPDNIGYEVRIESITGELITRAASNAPYKKIDVGDYEPGGYFVHLTIDSFSNSSTLIVK